MVSWLFLPEWQRFSVLVFAVLLERFDRYSFPPLWFRRHQQDSSRPPLRLAGDDRWRDLSPWREIGHLRRRAAQTPGWSYWGMPRRWEFCLASWPHRPTMFLPAGCAGHGVHAPGPPPQSATLRGSLWGLCFDHRSCSRTHKLWEAKEGRIKSAWENYRSAPPLIYPDNDTSDLGGSRCRDRRRRSAARQRCCVRLPVGVLLAGTRISSVGCLSSIQLQTPVHNINPEFLRARSARGSAYSGVRRTWRPRTGLPSASVRRMQPPQDPASLTTLNTKTS
jgi:hypothetical protein